MNDNLSDTDKNSPLPPTSKTDSNVSTDADLHLDKYSDPRVKITRTGILMGVGVVIIGILGAGLSIYARKTKLEQTTRFWGPETIIALQLAEKIELRPIGASDFEAVDLSGTPSLGHLRHALLDERGFDWNTEGSGSAAEMCQKPTEGAAISCIRLRFTDPTANRIGTIDLDLDLVGGWVGPSDGSRRVQATEWVRPKLEKYFQMIVNVQRLRYDQRD
ncbi:hypothetical protein N9B24_00690 [bacterium]|nr:hypothetical protein [bacterium]MDB4557887.1 hypothetical protein [bacterium]